MSKRSSEEKNEITKKQKIIPFSSSEYLRSKIIIGDKSA